MIAMSATLSGGSQGRLGLRYGGEHQGPFGAKIYSPNDPWYHLPLTAGRGSR